ncbi:MAG: hypothetical protein M1821_009224 [Bathelium mastoideum]|nr:MAG: hypothetical protein M1821_009224 [Bathelium mastoideum]KAI9682808.1 MAG: hypothetical protein M1822_006298 [Bathelium mastoideum]
MASVPPRPAPSQRRSSPSGQNSTAPTGLSRTPSHDITTDSVDSQTVLLNNPETQHSSPKSTEEKVSSSETHSTEDHEVRKCWICIGDETEDTPTTGAWRSPCPCALTAHESCLLDWVADMEAPSSSRNTVTSSKVQCPQCKNEIVLSRPRSLVVEGVNLLERAVGYAVAPGVIMILSYTVSQVCEIHGINTIYTIFGADDGDQILGPILNRKPILTGFRGSLLDHTKDIARSFGQNWRLDVGVPLIPVILILSRMTIIDHILPILPVVFFATQADRPDSMDLSQWPPSAALSFAVLPYLRAMYNAYYERIWAKKELEWVKQVQPRLGQENNDNGNGNVDPPPGDDEDVLEIDLGVEDDDEGGGVGLFDGWNNRNNQGDQDAQRQVPPNPRPEDAEHLADVAANQAQAQQNQQNPQAEGNQQGRNNNRPRRREQRLRMSLLTIATKFLGALFFPTVSSAVGELLRLSLNQSPLTRGWVTPPVVAGKAKPTGLLQLRWARSLVGGCMFVVVRDAVMLYARWRQAKAHTQRRIVDYEELLRKGLVKEKHTKKKRSG